MTETASESRAWTSGPLYKYLVQVLPAFVDNPFSADPALNVQKLREATGRSHEGVYKWLRASKLTPAAAKKLIEVAISPTNMDALHRLGRPIPKIEDLHGFVFAD